MKIGYSADFMDRMSRLPNEYKCGAMLLCGMAPIRNEQFEKAFHELLAMRFPQSVVSGLKIGSSEKVELYLCNRSIVNEFFALNRSTPLQKNAPNGGWAGNMQLLLAMETTKQAEASARKAEAEASARKAEASIKRTEFEMLLT